MKFKNYPFKDAYTHESQKVSDELFTSITKGLEAKEATKRLLDFGKNSITEKKSKSPIIIFLSQFKGAFVIILFVAAALSFYFNEWLDGFAILLVIIINAIIGFIMEYHAERSMEALKRLTIVNAKVMRNGQLLEIASDDIVPGDILYAEAGDIILADARIFNLSQLQVDESALTGESVAVDKEDKILTKDVTLAERVNMLYKGTSVTKGNVRGIVTGTGMETELGKIAAMVQSADQGITPLEKKISQFSKKILWLTVVLICIIFLIGVLKGDNIVALIQTTIALAVAAIPEGLPIVTTLALAQGMLKMAKHHVIVKKLSAVETLGGTNVICTDKTGTLTQNKIEVNTIITADEKTEIKINLTDRKSSSQNKSFEWVKTISVLCNTAELIFTGKKAKEVGDPLEVGLLKFAYGEGTDIEPLRKKYPKLKEEPFSSETKIMATLHKAEKNNFVAAKGAVEELLKHCTHLLKNGEVVSMDEATTKHWSNEAEKFAGEGLRIIAVAYKETNGTPDKLAENLIFAGLIGMLDPPRKEVFVAIQECKSAGIKVVMITGDHPATAKNIALKLGIIDADKDEEVVNGKDMGEFEKLSAKEKKRWLNSRIFARVSPKQKLDLVSVLQQNKDVVGMTGDGVNDAPAIKKADIGIAMGNRGTQVAQEVADMVLKNDSFSSIVLAIKQGRVIFENIRKFVIYLLSCNLSELLIISFTTIMNLHYGLFPLQILYINLVTDVLPALALGVTGGSNSIMKQPPHNSNEQIIDKKRWISIIVYSVVMAACCLGAVSITHLTIHSDEKLDLELCNNVLFITLILSQLWNVFNMTTDNAKAFYKSDVFRNKYVWYATIVCLVLTIGAYAIDPVATALSLYNPSMIDFAIMLGFSLLSLLIIQILKRTKIVL
ncbi:MAG: cation-translocating P-type ATPase [Bacteroidota bacterium]|nr:cation-translocating P-type ATPase [Bacteroidota bacterium]